MVGSFSDSHLTNTSDFTSQLTTFYRNNPRYLSAPLLSLDVESLFTNVPLGDVTGFLRRKLIDNSNLNLPDGLTIDILIKLIELCCASTIFSFNGSFYQQKFGVAMGSPLACILANIFMEYFETELRLRLPLQPAFWKRYVDDIICIWPHGVENFQSFLDGLNGLATSITLSVEWEVLNENIGIAYLPFLDVLIHRSNVDVKFSVYRKSSHCHMYIHYFSHHAPSVKKGVLSTLYLRALRVSSPDFLEAELDILWAAFKRLGYPDFFIKGALSAAKTKFHSTPDPADSLSIYTSSPSNTSTNTSLTVSTSTPASTTRIRKIFIFVPYDPFFVLLKQFLYATEYVLIFTYRVNTRNLVVRRRDSPSDPLPPRGVYRTPCGSCNKDYYGRTSRPINVRMSEHMKNIEDRDMNNSMFKHMVEHPGHEFNFEATRVLWKTRNVIEQKVVEASCISTLPNCNTLKGEIYVNPLLASVVMKLSNIPRSIDGTVVRKQPSLAAFYPTPVISTPPTIATPVIASTPSLPASPATAPRTQPPITIPPSTQSLSPPSSPAISASLPSLTTRTAMHSPRLFPSSIPPDKRRRFRGTPWMNQGSPIANRTRASTRSSINLRH